MQKSYKDGERWLNHSVCSRARPPAPAGASRPLRRASAALAVVVWALAACGPPARAGALDGLVLDYDVMRNGGSIGSHVVRFREADGRLVVETSVRIEVTFVFITLYRYALDATETWLDGRLVALSSATDDDGERLSVRAAADGDALRVETGAGAGWTAPGTIAPSSLWRRDMLGHRPRISSCRGTGRSDRDVTRNYESEY